MGQVICQKEDLHPGEIMEAMFGERSIVLCRSKDGDFYAFMNRCIHQGAPLSKGKLCSTVASTDNHGEYNKIKDGDILRCPWHGREFDITEKGCVLAEPREKLRSYHVYVEGNDVIVESKSGI
ncbi:Rieske (2Fe-2S) protein [Metabacillus idriensis]|uniref:Rieske (2Fe-2S) protein n=1 Tax=Metabacillus idriensis TaxID=324768 RepID=UPI00174DA316|nr:Rieske (2Fe-2S) protein [Metabacillus idriensis]